MKPLKGSRYCFAHDPGAMAKRAQARRTGGQHTRAPHAGNFETTPAKIPTIQDAAQILRYALEEALMLDNSIQRGRLLVAIATAYIDTIKIGKSKPS